MPSQKANVALPERMPSQKESNFNQNILAIVRVTSVKFQPLEMSHQTSSWQVVQWIQVKPGEREFFAVSITDKKKVS